MVKIRSKNQDWVNRDIILPLVGKVHFDEKRITVVKDAETAKVLVEIESLELELATSRGIVADKNSDKKDISKMNKTELLAEIVEMKRNNEDLSDRKKDDLKAIINMSQEEWDAANPVNSSIKEKEEEKGNESPELSKEEKMEYINSLDKMDELKELAAGFPTKEWEGIKSKAKLKEYLIDKVE